MLIAAGSSSINRPLSSCCRCSSFWIRSNYLGSVWVVSDRPFWIWPLFKSISARRVRTDTDLQYIDFYTVNILQNHWVGPLTWQLYRNKLLRFTAEYMMRQQTTLNTVKQHSVTTQLSSDSLDKSHCIYILVAVFVLECVNCVSANNPQDDNSIHNGVLVTHLVQMDA